MGLLQRMSDSGISEKKEVPVVRKEPEQKKSNSVGLLKKSLIISNEDELDFFEFLKRYDIKAFSILEPIAGTENYIAKKCFGLDAKSVCKSFSTKDFWDGLINAGSLYTFYKGSSGILPFNQFFSQKLLDSIKTLHIFKRTKGEIFIFIPKDNDYSSTLDAKDLEKLNFNFEWKASKNNFENTSNTGCCSYLLDFSEAIQSAIISESKGQYKDILTKTIEDMLYGEFLKNFSAPSKIEPQGNSQYIVKIFTEEEIPLELFSNHLRLSTSFYLEEHSQLIAVEYKGFSEAE